MSIGKISLHHIQWLDDHPITNAKGENAYHGVDGIVWYRIEYPPGSKAVESWMMQPFSRNSYGVTQTPDGRPVWTWDGNREAPTLGEGMQHGSYRCVDSHTGAHAHLHLRKGKIELETDSNVARPSVSTNPPANVGDKPSSSTTPSVQYTREHLQREAT